MNMQISPASTHSHQLRDPVVEFVTSETPPISNCVLRLFSSLQFYRWKYSAMVDLWICTWFVL